MKTKKAVVRDGTIAHSSDYSSGDRILGNITKTIAALNTVCNVGGAVS